jgi:hypothetical protein
MENFVSNQAGNCYQNLSNSWSVQGYYRIMLGIDWDAWRNYLKV